MWVALFVFLIITLCRANEQFSPLFLMLALKSGFTVRLLYGGLQKVVKRNTTTMAIKGSKSRLCIILVPLKCKESLFCQPSCYNWVIPILYQALKIRRYPGLYQAINLCKGREMLRIGKSIKIRTFKLQHWFRCTGGTIETRFCSEITKQYIDCATSLCCFCLFFIIDLRLQVKTDGFCFSLS